MESELEPRSSHLGCVLPLVLSSLFLPLYTQHISHTTGPDSIQSCLIVPYIQSYPCNKVMKSSRAETV